MICQGSKWKKYVSLAVAIIFFYVHIAYGAIEPAQKLWKERKDALLKIEKKEPILETSNFFVDSPLSPNSNPQGRLTQLPLTPKAASQNITHLTQLPSIQNQIRPNPLPKNELGFSRLNVNPFLSGIDPALKHEGNHSLIQSLPKECADIKEVYFPSEWKPGDLIVLHIQDAHENFQTQANIAKILESLNSKGQNKIVVGLEGAQGQLNFTPYRSFPDKGIVKDVADYFLKNSMISGAEYAGMTLNLADVPLPSALKSDPLSNVDNSPKSLQGDRSGFLFFGIEDEKLYLDHVRAFKDSIPQEKEAKKIVAELENSLNQLKNKILNQDLKELDQNMTLLHQGQIKLDQYLKLLTQDGIPSDSEMIRKFMNALNLEETLNYEQVEKERRALTNSLVEKLPKDELNNLASSSLSYRLGNISYGVFYQYLKDLCQAYGVSLSKYPEMDHHVRYVLLSERIHAEELFKEIARLEEKNVQRLIENHKEKQVIELSQDLTLLKKLTHYSLSPEEWDQYQKRINEIKRIEQRMNEFGIKSKGFLRFLSSFEKFNQFAVQRNNALVENLLTQANFFQSRVPNSEMGIAIQRSSSQGTEPIVIESPILGRVAVLIAGGFHTFGMTQNLKNKKIAYVVVSPRLGISQKIGTEYLEIFNREKMPLEKLFSGERITLKSSSPFAPVGKVLNQVVPTLEGSFLSFAMGLFIRKALSQITNLDKSVKKQIEKELYAWFKNFEKENGFRTIKKLKIKNIVEIGRNSNGDFKQGLVDFEFYGRALDKEKKRVEVSLSIVVGSSKDKNDLKSSSNISVQIKDTYLILSQPEPSFFNKGLNSIKVVQEYFKRLIQIMREKMIVTFKTLNNQTLVVTHLFLRTLKPVLVVLVAVSCKLQAGPITVAPLTAQQTKLEKVSGDSLESGKKSKEIRWRRSMLLGPDSLSPTSSPEIPFYAMEVLPYLKFEPKREIAFQNFGNAILKLYASQGWLQTIMPSINLEKMPLLYITTKVSKDTQFELELKNPYGRSILGGIVDDVPKVIIQLPFYNGQPYTSVIDLREDLKLSRETSKVTKMLFISDPKDDIEITRIAFAPVEAPSTPPLKINPALLAPIEVLPFIKPLERHEGLFDFSSPTRLWMNHSFGYFGIKIVPIDLYLRPSLYITGRTSTDMRFEMEMRNHYTENSAGVDMDNVRKILVPFRSTAEKLNTLFIDLREWDLNPNIIDMLYFSDPQSTPGWDKGWIDIRSIAFGQPLLEENEPVYPSFPLPGTTINVLPSLAFSSQGKVKLDFWRGWMESRMTPVNLDEYPNLYIIAKTYGKTKFKVELKNKYYRNLAGMVLDGMHKIPVEFPNTHGLYRPIKIDLKNWFLSGAENRITEVIAISDPDDKMVISEISFAKPQPFNLAETLLAMLGWAMIGGLGVTGFNLLDSTEFGLIGIGIKILSGIITISGFAGAGYYARDGILGFLTFVLSKYFSQTFRSDLSLAKGMNEELNKYGIPLDSLTVVGQLTKAGITTLAQTDPDTGKVEILWWLVTEWNRFDYLRKIMLSIVLAHEKERILGRGTLRIYSTKPLVSLKTILKKVIARYKNKEKSKKSLENKMVQKFKIRVQKELIPVAFRSLAPNLERLNVYTEATADNSLQVLHAFKLFQLSSIFNANTKKGASQNKMIRPENLIRVIRYMSEDEYWGALNSFKELYQKSPDKVKQSFGLFLEKLFRQGGEAATLDLSNSMTFEESLKIVEGFIPMLVSGARLTQEQKRLLEEVWNQGARKAEELSYSKLIRVEEEFAPQDSVSLLLDLFDFSEISEDKLSVLAKRIEFGAKSNRKIMIPVITNKDFIDIESLKDQLKNHYGITDEMFKKVGFGTIVITRKDLLEKQKHDPLIEIDTDMVYEIFKEKIKQEFNLRLFTDQVHRFKESWETKRLRIFIIASSSQVIEYFKEMEESLSARRTLLIQQ